ncbi:hypothetical protein COL05_15775 [Bacillus sp. AFS059628]|uniref:CFI-box-CTERM domain-containing protein n=1 Tax=Bacillus sp. AFS059628 TaxID=2033508 RepID=UPI000BF4EF43|nr:CFI-box-CTERM domain-containing protein [Bacillus sp. AFS059628]PFV80063.1 hypothetical protein COL05_15775 [Bacillus sp. AFS059628]
MAMFILKDAKGIGSNEFDTNQGFVDLAIIANDVGLGLNDPVNGKQQVTYKRSMEMDGAPQVRLDELVNKVFTPNYGKDGKGPGNVDIVVIPALPGFTLKNGTPIQNNAFALPPSNSNWDGANLNPTKDCLIIYDIKQDICVARAGTNGVTDLPISNPVVLYHEFSHAFRIVNNKVKQTTFECKPSSPEEEAAIVDENELRTQIAKRNGVTPELRDPKIYCGSTGCGGTWIGGGGGCCIIATVASKSLTSPQVQYLRFIRDHFVRNTEVGYAFFEKFFYDYYAFSPQVCTIMAGHPNISEILLEGYIDPLLEFWKIMIERSSHQFKDFDLGTVFVRNHTDRAQSKSRLEALHRTNIYWLNQQVSDNSDDISQELIALLSELAWPSDYIQWSLVAPVRIYHDLLTLFFDGANEQTIGREFNRALESWIPEVPINMVWASLSAEQVAKELEFCDTVLLQSASNRKRFRQRLKDQFSDITSVKVILDNEENIKGGA